MNRNTSQQATEPRPAVISGPSDVKRVFSVSWNQDAMAFEGVPESWSLAIPQAMSSRQAHLELPTGLIPLPLMRMGSDSSANGPPFSTTASPLASLTPELLKNVESGETKSETKAVLTSNSSSSTSSSLSSSSTSSSSLSSSSSSSVHRNLKPTDPAPIPLPLSLQRPLYSLALLYANSRTDGPTTHADVRTLPSSGPGVLSYYGPTVVATNPETGSNEVVNALTLTGDHFITPRRFLHLLGITDVDKPVPAAFLKAKLLSEMGVRPGRRGIYAISQSNLLRVCSFLDRKSLCRLACTSSEFAPIMHEQSLLRSFVRDELLIQRSILAVPVYAHLDPVHLPYLSSLTTPPPPVDSSQTTHASHLQASTNTSSSTGLIASNKGNNHSTSSTIPASSSSSSLLSSSFDPLPIPPPLIRHPSFSTPNSLLPSSSPSPSSSSSSSSASTPSLSSTYVKLRPMDWRETLRGLLRAKHSPEEFDRTVHVSLVGPVRLTEQVFSDLCEPSPPLPPSHLAFGHFVPLTTNWHYPPPPSASAYPFLADRIHYDASSSSFSSTSSSSSSNSTKNSSKKGKSHSPLEDINSVPIRIMGISRPNKQYCVRRVCSRRRLIRSVMWCVPEMARQADIVIGMVNLTSDGSVLRVAEEIRRVCVGVFGENKVKSATAIASIGSVNEVGGIDGDGHGGYAGRTQHQGDAEGKAEEPDRDEEGGGENEGGPAIPYEDRPPPGLALSSSSSSSIDTADTIRDPARPRLGAIIGFLQQPDQQRKVPYHRCKLMANLNGIMYLEAALHSQESVEIALGEVFNQFLGSAPQSVARLPLLTKLLDGPRPFSRKNAYPG